MHVYLGHFGYTGAQSETGASVCVNLSSFAARRSTSTLKAMGSEWDCSCLKQALRGGASNGSLQKESNSTELVCAQLWCFR